LPQKGDLSVVVDGGGHPVLVIETIEVFVVPFNLTKFLSSSPLKKEKRGRSLAYWRKAHENYFRRNDFNDQVFDERVPVVCERFRVVYTEH
jgi:histidinol-phosphate aminotransferase